MTRDEVVALLDRLQAALLASDASRVASLYARDATVISPMFGTAVGHGEIAEVYREQGQVFADIQSTVEARVIDGDRAVEVRSVHTRHVGETFGVPASQKKISFTMVFVFDLRDGVVAQERRLYDFTSVLVQLGVLRARPAHH